VTSRRSPIAPVALVAVYSVGLVDFIVAGYWLVEVHRPKNDNEFGAVWQAGLAEFFAIGGIAAIAISGLGQLFFRGKPSVAWGLWMTALIVGVVPPAALSLFLILDLVAS
jgi:hypothetical protein